MRIETLGVQRGLIREEGREKKMPPRNNANMEHERDKLAFCRGGGWGDGSVVPKPIFFFGVEASNAFGG